MFEDNVVCGLAACVRVVVWLEGIVPHVARVGPYSLITPEEALTS